MKKRWSIFLLSGASIVVGLVINSGREEPLQWIYQGKKERILESTKKLQATDETKFSVREIELDELLGLVEEKVTILDARPEIFHRLGHIPGALSLPREEFEEAYLQLRSKLESRKNSLVVVYCSREDCDDSKLVAGALATLGFRDVAIFKGGWHLWKSSHLSVGKAQSPF